MMKFYDRRPMPLFQVHRCDPAIEFVFRWWSSYRIDGILPCRGFVDTPTFRMIAPNTAWLDLREGSRCASLEGSVLAWFHDVEAARPPAEPIGDNTLAALMIEDIELVRQTGTVLFQEMTVGDDHAAPERWHVLLCPTADDGRSVTELAVTTAFTRLTSPVDPR